MEQGVRRLKALLKPVVLFWVRSGHREALTRRMEQKIRSLRGMVLDIGGGRDAFHDRFWSDEARPIRVDISPRLPPDVQADASMLPFSTASVNGVVMCELLEHVPEPGLVLREANRVLRPGGTLHGSVPFMMAIHGDPSDYFRYTAEGLRTLLQEFSDVEIHPHGNHVGAAWRLVSVRFPALKLANPVMRRMSRSTNAACPEGYSFVARKTGGSARDGEGIAAA